MEFNYSQYHFSSRLDFFTTVDLFSNNHLFESYPSVQTNKTNLPGINSRVSIEIFWGKKSVEKRR